MNTRHLIRIDSQHVQLGLPARFDIYSDSGKLLLGRGLTVYRADTVDRLQDEGFRLADNTTRAHLTQESVFRRISLVADQLNPIERALIERRAVSSFNVKLRALAETVTQCCDEDADAALAQLYLNCYHPYSVLHHILVAVVICVLTRAQQWSSSERVSLVAAALTHDLGVISGGSELGHAGPLTDAQRVFVREHPQAGVEFLTRLDVTDALWLLAVLEHHEHLDGSGYPSGIRLGLNSPAALMAVADGFAAMIRPRAYRNRKLGNDIIEDLRAHAGSWYNPVLVESIATDIGHYHAGSIVRLVSNDIAVVTRHRFDQPLAPELLVLADDGIQPLETPYAVDSADPDFAIKAALHPEVSLSFRNIVNRAWGG